MAQENNMRRIKKARIKHISLVPRGANQLPVIYKSDDDIRFATIIKDNIEEGELTAIVYAPETRDSQGDIASAEVIKEMAHDFAKNGEGIDIRHDGQTVDKDKAYVAESFIVQKDDERFSDTRDYDGNPVDVTGAWATVIKIDDESLRQEYRDGKWNGVSMGGTAVVEAEKTGKSPKGEIEMTKEEMQALLKENNEAVLTTVTTTLIKAGVLPDPEATEDPKAKPDPAPVFKGAMNSEADRKAHKKRLAIWKAEQDHADDAVALFEALEKIEEEFAEADPAIDKEAGIEEDDSPKVKELKRELAKERRASNQPVEGDGDNTNNDLISGGISKEDRDLIKDAQRSVRVDFYGGKE